MKRQRNQRSTKESAPPHKIIHLIVLAIALVIVLFGGWQLITPHQKLQKSWSINFTVPLAGTLVDGEKIYATDISGGFWQIHATTGAVEAYVPINMSTIYQPIAISNQLLGFISNQGTVIALDKSSLAEVWRIETDNFAEPELPQTDQHYLYFADRQSNVYVVDSKTGMLLWKKHLPRVSEVETSASVQPPTHTQFYSDGSSLYIGSVQSIYHCYLSSGQCQIIADDYNANLAIINASNNVIVYGDITNKYTVKDHITNKHIASLPRLLVFAVDANTVSLINKNQIAKYNLKSGDKTDIVTTDNQISSAIAADLDTVLGTTIQNHQTSSVFFTNSQQQALQWQTTLPQLCNQPSLIGEHVVVPCEQGLVYGIHSTNGAIAWRQPVIGSAKRGYTPLDQSDPLVIIQSDTPTQNSYLYGLDRKTGQILWKTPQLSIVTDSVMPTNKGVLMRSNQGHDLLLFAKSLPAKFKWPPAVRVATLPETSLISHINALCPLNRSLKLPLSMRIIRAKQAVMHFLSPRAITITETSNHPILELQVSGNDLSAVSAQFWQDFSRIEDRNGFIFRKNQFKVRFLPPQQGTWFWKVTAMAAGRKYVFTGSSKNLKLDQTNTLTISNSEWQRAGTPFNGVGWQTCITDRNYDGDWNDQWPLHTVARLDADTPSASLVSSQQYIQAMSEAGFNLMRFSFNNCSPKVTNCLTDTNLVFNQQTSAAIDSTLTVAKQNKMAVVFDIFGFEPWLEGVTDTKISPNLAKYLDYLIARYGSLIDVWELANESAPSEAWITAVSAYLKKNDPYQHPITISWERPDVENIDITELHYYDSELLTEVTPRFLSAITQAKQWSKPVLIGETGNKNSSFDDASLMRFIHKNWLSIFSGAAMVWWDHQSELYQHPDSANIYLGPLEKQSMLHSRQFIDAYLSQATLRRFTITNTKQETIWLGIETEKNIFLYSANPFVELSSEDLSLLPSKEKLERVFFPASSSTITPSVNSAMSEFSRTKQPYVLLFAR